MHCTVVEAWSSEQRLHLSLEFKTAIDFLICMNMIHTIIYNILLVKSKILYWFYFYCFLLSNSRLAHLRVNSGQFLTNALV